MKIDADELKFDFWKEWYNSRVDWLGTEWYDFAKWIPENYPEIKSVELYEYDYVVKEIEFHSESAKTQFLLKHG